MTDHQLATLLENPTIIRNRRKIWATRQNARVFLEIEEEFDSFDAYIWKFVHGKPIVHKFRKWTDLPAKTKESEIFSKDLKKRGMSFVGPTIIYSFMQAVGLVNDHIVGCWRGKK